MHTETRSRLRAQRRGLSPADQAAAAESIAGRALGVPELLAATRVALSFGDDGEVDPAPLADALRARGTSTWYPIVGGASEPMRFRQWDGRSELTSGRFGIAVPAGDASCGADELDVVVVPLVAFDAAGNRLGRGRGYYDRTLAAAGALRPFVVGLAHDLQEVSRLDPEPWDVPLDVVITPRRVIRPG